jgi:tellurite resistance protein
MAKRKKMNKVIAGYHMLMLISNVDGDFSPEEGGEIVDYLTESFPFEVSLDNELDILCKLPREDYFTHFVDAMNDFYEDSIEKERNDFLNKAVRMVIADDEITPEENKFLMELYNAWDIEHLE